MGAIVGFSCFGSVVILREDIGVRLTAPQEAWQPYRPVGPGLGRSARQPIQEPQVPTIRTILAMTTVAGALAAASPALAAPPVDCADPIVCEEAGAPLPGGDPAPGP